MFSRLRWTEPHNNSSQQSDVNFRGLAHILPCLISAIIGHGKGSAGEVIFGRFYKSWISAFPGEHWCGSGIRAGRDRLNLRAVQQVLHKAERL